MPLIISCANFPYCQNFVTKPGDKCVECQRKADQAHANRWRWAGFGKWVDNSHKHAGPKAGK